jgi:oligoendopeptidase F
VNIILGFEQLIYINKLSDWKHAYEEAIKQLDHLYQEEESLYYKMYAQGKQNSKIDDIQRMKHELMTSEELKATLLSWKDVLKDDHVWQRRLEVFLAKMNEEALDSHKEVVELQQKLQASLMKSHFTVNGKEYNLGSVHANIMENPDRHLRQQLLQQSQKVGEKNEELFRRLIQKRNKLAHDMGYSNYYHFKCSQKEINMDTYFKEMNLLLEHTRSSSEVWGNKIKEKFGWEKVHYYDQYFSTFHFNEIQNHSFSSKRMKEVLADVAGSLGIRIEQIPVSIESLEIPYGGFCINIHPTNIKLVTNKRDSYSAFLSGIHELGHAIDGCYSSYQYPELYRFYSSIAAESVAEIFQTIVTDKAFLMKNFNLGEEDYIQIAETNQLTDLNMVKINYYHSLVEYELYKMPDRSFQEIANDCYKRVFGIEGDTFHPASEMFYIENPAFFQDYNFALAIRDMIRNKFNIHTLYGEKEVFNQILKHFIEPNQLYSWQERLEMLCGERHTFLYLKQTLGVKV